MVALTIVHLQYVMTVGDGGKSDSIWVAYGMQRLSVAAWQLAMSVGDGGNADSICVVCGMQQLTIAAWQLATTVVTVDCRGSRVGSNVHTRR